MTTSDHSAATRATAATAPQKFLTTSGIRYAYRSFGAEGTRPIVFLNHLAANLDNWDPAVLDTISQNRHVITFDNRGIGATSGRVPRTIDAMADDVASFLVALGVGPVDIVALSMGGMVAQELALRNPELINKLVLVGTGPRGGRGIEKVTAVTLSCMARAFVTRADPKEYIFFRRNAAGKQAALSYLHRLDECTTDRDRPVTIRGFARQLRAIRRFARTPATDLGGITIPTLVVNGDHDIMVPTVLSADLAGRIPGARLEIFADSGHGSLFQFPERFATLVLEFFDQ